MQDVLESQGATTATGAGPRGRGRRPGKAIALLVAGVVVACFALIAPTLTWLEFSSGSENLNVATAMEILREDRWLLPTLDGEPRVAKPPLTAWITAAAIDAQTFQAMSSRDADIRARAERELA